MSQRRISVRHNDAAGTLQMKNPTMSRCNVAQTSQWYVSKTPLKNVQTTSQEYVTTTYHWQSPRCLKLVSNETPNYVLVVPRQDVLVVFLHNFAKERCSDISKVRNHNVSTKTQMKHPVKSQRQVSTLLVRLYVSFNSQIIVQLIVPSFKLSEITCIQSASN